MPSKASLLQAALRSIRDEALRKGEMGKAIAPPISARLRELGKGTGHTLPAYRGLEGPYSDERAIMQEFAGRPQWFSRAPEMASGYATDREQGVVIPAMLRLGETLKADANYAPWQRIPLSSLSDKDVARAIRSKGLAVDTFDDSYTDTQSLAGMARALGYDSLSLKNLRYPRQRGEIYGGGVDDVYAVFPSENIRAQYAEFNPKKKNETGFLLGLAASLGGAGMLREALKERSARA